MLLKHGKYSFAQIYPRNIQYLLGTFNIYENLSGLIFETQIHLQIDIRYFKPLSIATYYVATIHIKNLYLHEKTYNMDLK